LYQLSTLDNGIKVITERMENVRSVSIGVWFRVGSRDERAGQYGLSHFMEHMFFKGTANRDALAISQDFESLGAEQNAFTSKEYTCYYARVVDDRLPAVMGIIADMLTGSLFDQASIDSEREVVIEEIARSEDTPDDYVFELFSEAAMPGHNLGRQIIGSRQSVGSFMQDDCLAYREQHYHAANCVVVACGSLEHQAVVELAAELLDKLPAGRHSLRDDAAVKSLPFKLLQKDTEQAHMIYGLPGISAADDDRFAATLLDTALGGGMSSRLFQEIREKRGLAYAVYATTVSFVDAANFVVYVGTRPENLEEVAGLVRSELARMLSDGMDAQELRRMQDYVIGRTVLSQESTAARMIRLGSTAVNELELLSLDETIEALEAVSLDDVQRVCQRILGEPPTVAVISPFATDDLQARLQGLMA